MVVEITPKFSKLTQAIAAKHCYRPYEADLRTHAGASGIDYKGDSTVVAVFDSPAAADEWLEAAQAFTLCGGKGYTIACSSRTDGHAGVNDYWIAVFEAIDFCPPDIQAPEDLP